MIRNLRNSIAIQMLRDKKFLKAIAFILLYHEITNSNICKNYSVNNLSNLTGVHASTIKNRLQTLKQRNLAKINNGTLIFSSITSKHNNRNKKLNHFSFGSLIEIEKSLFALLVCMLQERKDFIHRAFLEGISYKKIAKKLGISIKSAFDYVKFAIEHSFLFKETHFKRVFYKYVKHYPIKGYTFTTQHFAYKVGANTYVVTGTSSPYYKYINNKNKKKKAA